MCDADYHRPVQDPYVGPMPNERDIFWWEFKSRNYNATISSLSQWSEFSNNFYSGRLIVSLDTCEFPVDTTVYNLFHNKVILEGGSWVRMNATLRKLYRPSVAENGQAGCWPSAVKLGTGFVLSIRFIVCDMKTLQVRLQLKWCLRLGSWEVRLGVVCMGAGVDSRNAVTSVEHVLYPPHMNARNWAIHHRSCCHRSNTHFVCTSSFSLGVSPYIGFFSTPGRAW